ncbi:MAG: ATP synthase F1 subunit epsilon [Lachnospiraceae bacterium]|nr:ATP synthase F1 subunit epsilon [Lachnospiraceae bacterium]
MAENTFKLKIITPERVFYEGDVTMVEFNTIEGQIGILKKHVPTTVIVSPGVLTITEEEGVKMAALHAGFAEILQEEVTILAELVEWPDEIDSNRAEEARIRAERRIAANDDGTDLDRAEIALKKAIARISAIK